MHSMITSGNEDGQVKAKQKINKSLISELLMLLIQKKSSFKFPVMHAKCLFLCITQKRTQKKTPFCLIFVSKPLCLLQFAREPMTHYN